jgi:hypothetical protein
MPLPNIWRKKKEDVEKNKTSKVPELAQNRALDEKIVGEVPASISSAPAIRPYATSRTSTGDSVQLYPDGDARREGQLRHLVLKGEATAQHIQRLQIQAGYAAPFSDEGVVVKCFKDRFTFYPEILRFDDAGDRFFSSIVQFNVKVFWINSHTLNIANSYHRLL